MEFHGSLGGSNFFFRASNLNKALSLKNVDHALCEFNKYSRSAQGIQVKEREYSSQKSRVTGH